MSEVLTFLRTDDLQRYLAELIKSGNLLTDGKCCKAIQVFVRQLELEEGQAGATKDERRDFWTQLFADVVPIVDECFKEQTPFFDLDYVANTIAILLGQSDFCNMKDTSLVLKLDKIYTRLVTTIHHNNFSVIVMTRLFESQKFGAVLTNAKICYKDTLSNVLFAYVKNYEAMDRARLRFIKAYVGSLGAEQRRSVLEHLWNAIYEVDSLTPAAVDTLVVLCPSIMSIPLTHSQCLLKNDRFWQGLQSVIVDPSQPIRKKGNYLLKRSVDLIVSSDSRFESDAPNPILLYNVKLQKSCNNQWRVIFLLLDSLEEKQAHLLKPLFPCLDELESWTIGGELSAVRLHPTWITVIFKRFFDHINDFIVSWGINRFLTCKSKLYERLLLMETDFFLGTVLPVLGKAYLYQREPEDVIGCPPIISRSLCIFFKNLQQACIAQSKHGFFVDLITAICTPKTPWTASPLFYITENVVGEWRQNPVLGPKEMELIQNFVQQKSVIQEGIIWKSIVCNFFRLVLKHADFAQLTLTGMCSIFASFSEYSSLRSSLDWTASIKFVKDFCNQLSMTPVQWFTESLLSENSELTSVNQIRGATTIVLLFLYAFPEKNNACNLVMEPIVAYLDQLESRAYCSMTVVTNVFLFIKSLLLDMYEMGGIGEVSVDVKLLVSIGKCISTIYLKILHYLTQDRIDLQTAESFVELIRLTISTKPLKDEALGGIRDMVKLLDCEKLQSRPIPGLRILSVLSSIYPLLTKEANSLSTNMLKAFYQFALPHILEEKSLQKLLKEETEGKHKSKVLEDVWSCAEWYAGRQEISQLDHVYATAEDSLPLCSPTAVMAVFRFILASIESASVDKMKNLLDACWICCLEARGSEIFWKELELFVKIGLSPKILSSDESVAVQIWEKLLDLGGSVSGVMTCAAEQVCVTVAELQPEGVPLYPRLVVDLLLFGSVHRKDQRVSYDTSGYIVKFVNQDKKSGCAPHQNDGKTRGFGIKLISMLNFREVKHRALAGSVLEMLVEKYDESEAADKRYYGSSLDHRIRHRALTGLLLLQTYISRKEKNQMLLKWSLECLSKGNPHPSVRYQLEWLAVRILVKDEQQLPTLYDTMLKVAKERVGALGSFISICYHFSRTREKEKQSEHINKALDYIMPWAMAQHFNTRLYAQVAALKLSELSQKLPEVSAKWGPLLKCLNVSMVHGNTPRNAEKMTSDFYFSVFHPFHHFALETLLVELPRLSKMSPEEWISPFLLEDMNFDGTYRCPLYVPHNVPSLKKCEPAQWVMKAHGGNKEVEFEENKGTGDVFQRKVTPWKSMIPDADSVEGSKRSEPAKLIVAASLIDKATNLGGLCRTCEVFGAQELTVPSLCLVEEQDFTSLSVCSEKWIQITEVKQHDLILFLKKKKSEGYHIVGVEQTSNSVPLQDFQFVQKTLLVLGKEKEGIPVDLLAECDVCVEIPQKGVTRSLNVHVSGAICIWEYSRQQMLQNALP